jgi:hypothetical protein
MATNMPVQAAHTTTAPLEKSMQLNKGAKVPLASYLRAICPLNPLAWQTDNVVGLDQPLIFS